MRLNEEFIDRYNNHVDHVLKSVHGEGNKRVFLQASYDIIQGALRYDNIYLTKNLVKQYIGLSATKRNGWFRHEKTMMELASKLAMDVTDSVLRRNAA